ncbi:tetratricopeptide repeat protein [Faunimonas pinastri]|nr:tetratricopeptide repeat protein [Faunimonas pinastri]
MGRSVPAIALAVLLLGHAAHAATVVTEDFGEETLAGDFLSALNADAEKDLDKASFFYQRSLHQDPDDLLFLERALVLSASTGEMADAQRYADTMLRRAPDSRAARLVLAVADFKEGKYPDAQLVLGTKGTDALGELTKGLLNAWADFGRGNTDQALARIQSLKGEAWFEPFKLLHSSYIATLAGRSEDALKLLKQARDADQNAVRITEGYARVLAQLNRRDEAVQVLDEYLTRFPDNPLATATLAEIKSGKPVKPSVGTPAQGAAEVLAGIGAALGDDGGIEVPTLFLRLAMHLDPNASDGLAAVTLGSLLVDNGNGDTGIKLLESVDPAEPFRSLGLLRAALALDQMDKAGEAETAFKASIERNPDDIQARIAFGNMLRSHERFKESADLYSSAISKIPNPGKPDWTIFYFRGIDYERDNQWPKAEADFKKALELFPDQPLVLNYLGYSWVDRGLNMQPALDMIRKAVELRPKDGFIVDSLGWAFYKLGRYPEAVEQLENAVALRPEDPTINDHLGDAYWKTGRVLEAQFQWRHARDLGAKEPDLALINRKIAARQLIEKDADPAPQGQPATPPQQSQPAPGKASADAPPAPDKI